MNPETIDHSTLSRLAEAGTLRSTHITGQHGGWSVVVKYGMAERTLAAQRSQQARVFRKFETLVNYLKGLGIDRFDVDTVNYDPQSLTRTRNRPDRSAAMKAAHEAAAYDTWLKAEVQEAIDDSDPSIPHEEVMLNVRSVIAQARAAKRA